MPEIWAGIIFYNDIPQILESCLKSCKEAGLKIIAIDGAFQEFPLVNSQKLYSTDGCYELAREYADIFVPCPVNGWFNQAEKRSEYFRQAPVGSYVLVIDADESLWDCGGINPDLEDDIYKIGIVSSVIHTYTCMVRCYKVYEDLRYEDRHCSVVRTDLPRLNLNEIQKLVADSKYLTDLLGNNICVDHHSGKRPESRKNQNDKYKRYRKENQ